MATRKELISYGKDYLIDLLTAACKIEDIHKQFVAESVKVLETTQWISVDKRLPNIDEYQDCNGIFIVTDGNRRYTSYFDIYKHEKFGHFDCSHNVPDPEFEPDNRIVAWMPMPKYNESPFESTSMPRHPFKS